MKVVGCGRLLSVGLCLAMTSGCESDAFKYIAGGDLEARCRTIYYDDDRHREQHLRLLAQVSAMDDEDLAKLTEALDVSELSDNRQKMGLPADEELLPYYVAYEAVRRAVPDMSRHTDAKHQQKLLYYIRNAQNLQLAGARIRTYADPNTKHYCQSFLSFMSHRVHDALIEHRRAPEPYGPAPTIPVFPNRY